MHVVEEVAGGVTSSMVKGSGSAVKLIGVAKRYADVVAVDACMRAHAKY